jgi:DNA-3-methyladenine glycosylase
MTRRLDRSDYAVDPVALARSLLGRTLVRSLDGERLAGVIVETEAYCGPEDKAAHSVGWRRTRRTEPMFGPPGTSYVFLTYGMHNCFNVVCGALGEPVAVLVRALEPIDGLDAMRAHRARPSTRNARPKAPGAFGDTSLCSGPAKLCQAIAIDRRLNAIDLVTSRQLWIEETDPPPSIKQITNTTRIGVEYAAEWATKPLRWYITDSPHVSVRLRDSEPTRGRDRT